MMNRFHRILFVTTLLFLFGIITHAMSSPKPFLADTTGTPEKVKMPVYPGGESEMIRFLSNHINYPEKAVRDSIDGKVVLHFTVSKTGKIKDVNIVNSLSPECDAEAIRVVESMPDWIPGVYKGQNVDVIYTLPIRFSCGKLSKNVNREPNVLIFLDGKQIEKEDFMKIKPETIESVNVIKDKTAMKKYGNSAEEKDGVIIITLKKK